MKLLEVHARLATRRDWTELQDCFDVTVPGAWSLLGTALVKLSGRMESCENESDLTQALHSGLELFKADGITDDMIQNGAARVLEALEEFEDKAGGRWN